MKWGILATGNIAKKFASTINQMSKENEQLAAVGSRHMDSAKAFAREYDIPRYYDSYEALVNDPDVEAVYVATPNSLHYENCRLCLEHGKHVLCEKPFTINEKQALSSNSSSFFSVKFTVKFSYTFVILSACILLTIISYCV